MGKEIDAGVLDQVAMNDALKSTVLHRHLRLSVTTLQYLNTFRADSQAGQVTSDAEAGTGCE